MANSPVMTVEVLRYNPENDQEPHLSSYQVPYDNHKEILFIHFFDLRIVIGSCNAFV